MVLCRSSWTEAGFGFFVTNEYGRGGERRQRKPEGLKVRARQPDPALPEAEASLACLKNTPCIRDKVCIEGQATKPALPADPGGQMSERPSERASEPSASVVRTVHTPTTQPAPAGGALENTNLSFE